MSNPLVIDLSHWNEEPDWAALKAAGTVGVILKCTQGTGYVDPTFGTRATRAREAGLAVASYHFLEHGGAANQMRWYLERLQPAPGDRLVIDFEQQEGKPDPNLEDLEMAAEFLLNNTACEVAIYGASFLFDTVQGCGSEVLAGTSLWAARYSDEAPEIEFWPDWDLWQFTDEGHPQGTTGNIDCNRWNPHAGDIHDWFYSPDAREDSGLPVVSIEIHVDRPCVLIVNGTRVETG